MTAFDEALELTLGHEGGFVDDPADSGGATRFGITEAVARAYGYEGPMSVLPAWVARDIYKRRFWDGANLSPVSDLSKSVAMEVFDSGVNVGPGRASKWLQRALNSLNDGERLFMDIKVDGEIGTKTLGALSRYLLIRGREGEAILVRLLNCIQGYHYLRLSERRPKDERFMYGWIRTRVS